MSAIAFPFSTWSSSLGWDRLLKSPCFIHYDSSMRQLCFLERSIEDTNYYSHRRGGHFWCISGLLWLAHLKEFRLCRLESVMGFQMLVSLPEPHPIQALVRARFPGVMERYAETTSSMVKGPRSSFANFATGSTSSAYLINYH